MKTINSNPQYSVWEKLKIEEREIKKKLQEKFCLVAGIYFIPDDELCPKCKKNILDFYTQQECSTKNITSCKLCNCSFLD
jgi:hypothetical protein